MIRRISALFLLLSMALNSGLAAAQPVDRSFGEPTGVRLLISNDERVVLELTLPEYRMETVSVGDRHYQRFSISIGQVLETPGSPQVPVVGALIAVPPDVDLSLEILEEEPVVLDGEFELVPSRAINRDNEDFQPGSYSYPLSDPEIVMDSDFPQAASQIQEIAWMRDQRLARLSFYPFQYSASHEAWIWRRRMLVQVSFQGDAAPRAETILQPGVGAGSDAFSAFTQSAVLNPDSARLWRGMPEDSLSSSLAPGLPDQLPGPRYRIEVAQDGIYRLTYSALQAAGLPVADLDPTTLSLSSQGDPVAIHVTNTDGDSSRFSPGEAVLFYAQRFYGERMAQKMGAEDDLWLTLPSQLPSGATTTWTPQLNALMLEKYTHTNVYWLTYDGNPGLRMDSVSGAPGGAAIPTSYRAVSRAEKQLLWKTTLFTSEETWFWDQIVTNVNSPEAVRTYTTTLHTPALGTYTAALQGEIAAESNDDFLSPDHRIQIYFNDAARALPPVVDASWDGKSRFRFSATIPQARLVNGANRIDLVAVLPPSITSDILYFDWFEMVYDRQFQAVSNQITFSGQNAGVWRYQVSGFTTSDLAVLDISSPLTPTLITGFSYSAGLLTFEQAHDAGAQFTVARLTDLSASDVQYYSPPDFDQSVDYIFIAHQDLLASTQVLADHRSAQGISARVYDMEDVIRQFNEGIYNPYAIKNFLAYAFSHWDAPPTYVMLVGDGHWNFLHSPGYDFPPIYMPPLLSWVDPWQGEVDSANLLATLVGSDPLPDVFISRLPVNSPAQLQSVINKIITYESAPMQEWQRSLIFAADDTPDVAGNFVALSESVIADYITPGWSAERVYLDTYTDGGACGNPCLPATQALTSTMASPGGLVLSYTGHGGINFWSSPVFFRNQDIPTLENSARLPVLLSLTCLDGYWLHPDLTVANRAGPGMVEELLRQDQTGIVAAFSPTGLGVATGHDALQRGFLDAFMSAGDWRLGAASVSGKLSVFATGGNFDLIHTFTVFGDPALRLRSPHRHLLSPLSDARAGAPGSVVEYTLQVTNTGAITDTYQVTVAGALWSVDVLPLIGPVAPGTSQPIAIQVHIPAEAQENDLDQVDVLMRSMGDISQFSTAVLTTTAHNYGAVFFPAALADGAPPGDTVSYTLAIENIGRFLDSFDIAVAGNQWSTQISQTQVENLEPGTQVNLQVVVSIPASVENLAQDVATLTAVSRADPARSATAELITTAGLDYSVEVTPQADQRAGAPGTTLIYALTVRNSGLLADTYHLAVSGNRWTTAIPPADATFPLSSGESRQVDVFVLLPVTAVIDSDTAIVTVSSQTSVGLQAQSVLTSTLTDFALFLPNVRR